MKAGQALVLSMLKTVQAFKENLSSNPSLIKQPVGIIPKRYQTIDTSECSPGTVLYTLKDKPRFVGVVQDIKKCSDNKCRITFVSGCSQTVPLECTLYTCCE